jgi:DNA adenine methylase
MLIETDIEKKVANPFLRWAGGKRWLIPYLKTLPIHKINNYHEPFLGGGAVFFNLTSYKKAYLSDLNPNLINAFNQVKLNLNSLVYELRNYRNEKEFFYYLRQKKFECEEKQAAQLIFLNRTSYNGLYRLNQRGDFNVPYGNKQYAQMFDFDNLTVASQSLKKAELFAEDFEVSLKRIKIGDLVFLDPPYTTAHENNGFVKYNQKIFSWDDQVRLLDYLGEIKKRGAFFIMTNAFHLETKKLFSKIAAPVVLERSSTVGAKKESRKTIHELIFTNL